VRPLTTDLSRGDLRPYFLWDEDISGAELREALVGADTNARQRLLGKLLREARDTDVWLYVTPDEVAEALPDLTRHLGRRKEFWQYVIRQWREHGLVR
jgi:hypothetical protein